MTRRNAEKKNKFNQTETSAKLPGSAGILPASWRFFNDSPAGSQRSQRGARFCRDLKLYAPLRSPRLCVEFFSFVFIRR
jgi:hypothetical protein